MEVYDISWMWIIPSQDDKERVRDGTATAYEKIRVLLADGINSDGHFPLLAEFYVAASQLPQRQIDVLTMYKWKVESGITTDWLRVREHVGGDNE